MGAIDRRLIDSQQHIVGFGVRLRRYFGVLLALLRREEDQRRQAPFVAIANMGEPLILIAVLTGARYLLDRFHAPPIGDSALLFFATGVYCKYAFTTISRKGRGPIRMPYHRFPIEQRLDHILVNLLLRTSDYCLMGFILFCVIYIFVSSQAWPVDFTMVALGLGSMVCLAFGWSIINLVIGRFFWVWPYLTAAFNRCLIIFSGVFYLPDFLSPDARYILSFNPLTHGIILFRKGFYPNYPSIVLDTHYLAGWVVGSIVIGLMLERVSRRFETQ